MAESVAEREAREARLPKWAQGELKQLRRLLSEQLQLNAELRGDIPGTNTWVSDYTHADRPLPANARIIFQPHGPDTGHIRRNIQAYIENGALRIQGDYSLTVHPSASNSLAITLERSYR
jgi:hypothetical protein